MGRTIARWCAALLLATLLASFLVVSTSGPASAAGEGTILALVNQDRAANGLGPLSLNSSLSAVSTAWANQMAANGAMTHNPDFSSQIPGGWSHAGENVAQGFATPTDVHNGWMNSPGHRANILGDYTDIGIAFISAGGTTWAVENFAKYGGSVPAPAPPAPAPAPAPPAPAPAPAPPAPAPPAPPAPASPASSAHTAPIPATNGSSSPSAVTPSIPGTSEPMPPESASVRGSNHNPIELAKPNAGGSTGTVMALSGLPGLLIGILLGLLILVSSAWTGVLLRRRWQK